MNDFYLERLAELTMTNATQSAFFLIGSSMAIAGLTAAVLANGLSEKWCQRGQALLYGGVLMASPACLDILATVLGGSTGQIPSWMLSTMNVAVPILGAFTAIALWIGASRRAAQKPCATGRMQGDEPDK